MSDNLYPVGERAVTRAEREAAQGHRGAVLWLTGLSGAGKSTVALAAERALFAADYRVRLLDGDDVRTGLNAGLTFSLADRRENTRRVAEVAKLFCDTGFLTLSTFISPTRAMRAAVAEVIGPGDFHEVHVAASLEVCEARDVKGLYRRARAGEIPGFTGVDSPYEPPTAPSLVLPTGERSLPDCTERLVAYARRVAALTR